MSSSSFTSTTTPSSTCLVKVLTERIKPPSFLVTAAAAAKKKKKSSQSPSYGLQRSTQKKLSHILRTEAAIEAIEKKANSNKHNRLWPKAVLEALDDAIRANRWESALKVCVLLMKSIHPLSPLPLIFHLLKVNSGLFWVGKFEWVKTL